MHVLEEDELACLDRLEADASSSNPDDLVDACAGRARDERDAQLDEKALRLAMVSSVRPERSSLFWHTPESFHGSGRQLVAVLLKDTSTVFGGWPRETPPRIAAPAAPAAPAATAQVPQTLNTYLGLVSPHRR